MKQVFCACCFGVFLAVLLLPMLAVNTAQAVIIEIPIPEFTGPYDENNFGDNSSFFPFIYDPADIVSVSIRLSGSTEAGIAICLGDPGPWPIEVFSHIGNYSGDEFWMASPGQFLEDGSFEVVMVFGNFPSRPDTWNLLDDGGDIGFFVAPAALLGICSGEIVPTIEIDEFVLVFDMALVVPVEQCTWDCIKAQYR